MSSSDEVEAIISPLLNTSGSRQAEFSVRKKSYQEDSFENELREIKEKEGWVFLRQNKLTIRMRQPRKLDEILENRFWNVLYKFGYDELNKGRNCQIIVNKSGGTKQIDVFAKDEETVIIAECMASESIKKRSMQKYLEEFGVNQKPIANAIREFYGPKFKPKIIWFFVTDRIRWSANDLDLAKRLNINVVQTRELMYFEEIAKNLGKAAKYQFQAEYLSMQKVPAFSNRKVPAIKTKLGGKKVYLFSARPIDILRIAFVNHRDLRDPAGSPTYQRLVNPTRLKSIAKFLDEGGVFPNTILLNFRHAPRFEKQNNDDVSGLQFGQLVLPDRYKSCWVVDGQHRLYGTTFSKNANQDNLFFLAFDKLEPEDEADTFITINDKQSRVPKKLLAELDGDVKWNSHDPKERLAAIASRAVDLLNNAGSGPFEDRVITPGVTPSEDRSLTLPSFQQAILQSRLLGYVSNKGKDFVPGPCWEQNSEKSMLRLVELLSSYFELIERANLDRWLGGKSGYLCTNFGVAGHVRLLAELIEFASHTDSLNPIESEVEEILSVIDIYISPVIDFIAKADDQNFEGRFKVPFGSGGLPMYFFSLVSLVNSVEANFKPEGYEEYIRTVSEELTSQADQQVKWIQTKVPEYVIEVLKNKYGKKFFEKGVPKQIQLDCLRKRIEDDPDKQLADHAYLDWIHIMKIVMLKEHKDLFKDVLSIKLENENAGKHFFNQWFEDFNEIRRIPAHPAGRFYKQQDIDFLEFISEHLKKNLE